MTVVTAPTAEQAQGSIGKTGSGSIAIRCRFARGALMAVAAVLETLQALTPDRSFDYMAAFYGAARALAAALVAELFCQRRRSMRNRAP